MYAPIILFTYCRKNNTQLTIEHLLKNDEARLSDLIIYSDAPKDKKAADKVQETRDYLHTIRGFKTITIIERENNYGLAQNIVDGVTTTIKKYGKVIVLEDDLSVSPYFLKYMNEGLERYKNRDDVISIHGYSYPVKQALPEAFLIKGADCWGWATWERGWRQFSFNAKALYDEIIRRHQEKEFEFNHSYPYMKMLKKQCLGKANSWAICWYASAFLKNKYTLYPGHSLVQVNSINDIGATHGTTPSYYGVDIKSTPVNWDFVEDNQECMVARKSFEKFFHEHRLFRHKILSVLKLIRKYI